jgi:tight adherence protein C
MSAGFSGWSAPSLASLLVMLAVTLLFYVIGSAIASFRRQKPPMQRQPRGMSALPTWVRVLMPVVALLAAPVGPRLPVVLRQHLQRALRKAGLDEELTPQELLALAVVCGAVALALATLLSLPWAAVAMATFAGMLVPAPWLRSVIRTREWEVTRDLPVYVDMLILALEAGGALSVALRVATDRCPDSVLRRAFERVQVDLRAGRARAEALRALGDRLDVAAITPFVAALVQADGSGASLAAVLRAQADQRLAERFTRAEKLALEAPVKMLGPLVLCIFPCTFLVLGFPVVVRFFDA